jgi:hypothetical protein
MRMLGTADAKSMSVRLGKKGKSAEIRSGEGRAVLESRNWESRKQKLRPETRTSNIQHRTLNLEP